jgi:hypothetical protein
MTTLRVVGRALFLMIGLTLLNGCVVEPREGYYGGEPREGYYDREHHRWYHEHRWRDCDEHEEHCHD